jgi:catechol 2,3-dioxygenase-like lactoylglutathione lyase family enzyme
MFSHIVVGANDVAKAKQFYDAALGALGIAPGAMMGETRIAYAKPGQPRLMVGKPLNGEPACHANGGTLGFQAETPAQVDAFHAAAVANGGTTCEDPPGLRDFGVAKMYLAYVRDPAGNKLCAVCHQS